MWRTGINKRVRHIMWASVERGLLSISWLLDYISASSFKWNTLREEHYFFFVTCSGIWCRFYLIPVSWTYFTVQGEKEKEGEDDKRKAMCTKRINTDVFIPIWDKNGSIKKSRAWKWAKEIFTIFVRRRDVTKILEVMIAIYLSHICCNRVCLF